MHLVNLRGIQAVPSAEQLATKILNHLMDLEAADARLVLDKVITHSLPSIKHEADEKHKVKHEVKRHPSD